MKSQPKKQIQLDASKLVGFTKVNDQKEGNSKLELRNGVKVGTKVGSKVGGKTTRK